MDFMLKWISEFPRDRQFFASARLSLAEDIIARLRREESSAAAAELL
jgi:hypothetical protein